MQELFFKGSCWGLNRWFQLFYTQMTTTRRCVYVETSHRRRRRRDQASSWGVLSKSEHVRMFSESCPKTWRLDDSLPFLRKNHQRWPKLNPRFTLSLISHKNILIKTHRDSLCERERQREWHTLTLCFVWNQEPAVLFSFDFIHENLDRFCLFKHSGGLPSCNLCLNKKLTIKRFVLRHVQI